MTQFKPWNVAKEWGLSEWAVALAGEVGELCDGVKKVNRGRPISKEYFSKELADINIYLNLLAQYLEIDLDKATKDKYLELETRKERDACIS